MGRANHLFTNLSSMACGGKLITMQIKAVHAPKGAARAFVWFVYLSGGLNFARRGIPYIIGSAANTDKRVQLQFSLRTGLL